ncbi:hypothetical protein EV401DRAFT_1937373 [Pisolithus croceorrhizus]|nr:hypothetical protein EV401DRAFT_1937373 [Pisolithus croceorrhizus]
MTSETLALMESYSYALMYLANEASTDQSAAACVSGAASRPTSSLLRLPPEIIYGIISFLSPSELAGILTLSRRLKPIVERVLYRELEPNKARVIPCLKTIVAYPSLASTTRRVTICDLSRSYDMLSGYLSLLSRALHSMPVLTDLTLLLAGPHAKYFLGCPFRLRSLSTTLTWDDVFIQWMEEQSELSSVMFGGAFVSNSILPPNALPNISQISATPLILSSVVPGRPVKVVEIYLPQPECMKDDIMRIIMRILSFSTESISSIQIITRIESMAETLGALNTIPENIPKLDSFALHAGHGPFTHEFLESLDTFLSGFECLRSITFLSRSVEGALSDRVALGNLATEWHKSCPTLECISFPGLSLMRNLRYGWVTLEDLERILCDRNALLLGLEV